MKYTTFQKCLAWLLTLVLVIGLAPGVALAVPENHADRTADAATIDAWKPLFTDPDAAGVKMTTENAGGIWTDKSVFTADNVPAQWITDGIQIADKNDNFLVALSAIASNKEITGYSTIPTDTVFILDLSSSMQSNDDRNQSAIDELVDATNKAITDLLALNRNNRVGVVLYAGNTSKEFNDNQGITTVLMPIDTYTTNRAGTYLEAYNSNLSVRVFSGVRNSGNQSVSASLDSARGTFIQDGVYEAMKLFLAQDTKVTEGVQAGTTRIPIMVLMTDGEPTMANNDYNGNAAKTDLGTSNMYLRFNNQDYNHRYSIAFMTQLTAAFAKREMARHYDTNALLYTLAYGEEVTRLPEALAVMDPAQDTVLNDFWAQFLAGEQVTVFTTQRNTRPASYTYLYAQNDPADPLTARDKLYTTDYFPADTDQELHDAFEAIVDEIILQSKYYPTYVQDDHDHDGYITFADKIGGYMEVVDIKGILIGDTYYSGAAMAKTVIDGSLGTVDRPSVLGDVFIQSVKERLGISETATARQLVQNAFDYGQLAYDESTGAFSNYIGWYSDEDGNYLDFWHESITSAPPAGATHIIKSYGVLGQTDPAHGISASDMLYASIRVAKELNDFDGDGVVGETQVIWQIPASLIPTITYQVEVEVDSDGTITNVTNLSLESSQVAPIRLVYEVALQEDLHDWNITEKINAGYRDSTANKDAGFVFYTNQWNKAGENPQLQTNRNTYSHFEPSTQNERYYYTQDTVIYDSAYNPVTGAQPSTGGTYYRQYPVYEALDNGTFRIHYHYERISAAALASENLTQNESGQWMVKKGVIHRYYNDYQFQKGSGNHTDTMDYYFYPMIEVLQGSYYYSAVTLGNNGKLTVTPATGVKVSKTVSEAVAGASDTFNFVISGGSGNAELIRLDANGDEAARETLTFTGGEAAFTLKDGETVYIIGLEDGRTYTISEQGNSVYSVSSVLVNGAAAAGNTATFVAANQTIQSAAFTNSPKGYGNLYITKEVESDHAIPGSILAEVFELQVHVGAALVGEDFTVKTSAGSDLTATVDAGGYLKVAGANLTIVNGQRYGILGLPEGTVVTVEELLTSGQSAIFQSAILTRDHTGAEQETNNTVTVYKDGNGTANIINTYHPQSTTVSLNVKGTKTFNWDSPVDATFTFQVQQWNGTEWVGLTGKTASVTYTTASVDKQASFQISDVLSGVSFDRVGTHTYRVVEVIPEAAERLPGVTYDRTVFPFTVTITDSNGQLEAIVATHGSALDVTGGIFTVNASFRNEYHTAPVSINVSKTVVNTSATAEISAAGFSYTAVRTDATGQILTGTDAASLTLVTDGAGKIRFSATYNVAGDYYYTVSEDIPAGAVLVTEGKYAGKYFLEGWYFDATEYFVHVNVTYAEGSSTDLVATVSVDGGAPAGNDATVTFTNTYDPTDAKVDLNVSPAVLKHLEGRPLNAGEFTFYIYNNNDRTNALLEGTNDADGKVTFNGELSFDKVGVYHYDVVEAEGSVPGVTYDKTVYDMVIVVEDNDLIDGKLDAYYYYEDSVSQQVTFRNTYKPADAQLVLDGTKKLSGRNIINAEFRFKLTQVTDATGATAVAGGLNLTAENGPHHTGDTRTATFAFAPITYTGSDAGKTFYYLIEELHSGEVILGVTHNTENASFVVKVTVSDPGTGVLTVTEEIVKGGSEILFRNVYIPQGTYTEIPAIKDLTGRVLGDGEFSFLITEKTDDTYATDKDGGVQRTVQNNADGSIVFGKLDYDTVGHYYYVVEEQNNSLGGIAYDTTKYHVHVEVTDNGIGHLVATVHLTMVLIPEEGAPVYLPTGGIDFHNVYAPRDGQLVISGNKNLLGGKELTDGEFTFALYEGDTLLGTAPVKAADKTFSFDPITYTAEDIGKTFTYTVKEVIPADATDNGDGTWTKGQYIYDGSVFTVVVTVKDDVKDGVLEITKTVNGSETAQIVFENTFVPDSVEHTLQAKKEYDKGLKGNDFIFSLKSADGKLSVDQEKKNDAEGNVIFDPVSFPEAGTYTFTVKEIGKILGFIRYSVAEYKVTVQVINVNGVLSVVQPVTVEKIDGAAEENNLIFINHYVLDGEGEVTLTGKKTLTGDRTNVNAGEFTFGLYDAEGKLIESVTNDAAGNFGFTTLKFNESHTVVNGQKQYTYTVKEIPGEDPYITYDEKVYQVVITVTDNAEGGITVTHTINGAADGVITFANVYTEPDPITALIDVTKIVENKTEPGITPDGFEILLHQGEEELSSVKTDAEGKAFFQLTYSLADVGKTYTYKVTEKKGSLSGVTYDKTVHEITITVEAKEDGTLYTVINGQKASSTAVSFTNVYEKPASPDTGDHTPIFLSGGLMLLSLAGIALLLTRKRKETV